MERLRFPRFLGFVFAIALAAAYGQVRDAVVKGTVTDQNGRPIEGAAVQLEDTATLAIRSYITQADGKFEFRRLLPKIDYELRAQYHGQSSDTKRISQYDLGNGATVVNLTVPLKE